MTEPTLTQDQQKGADAFFDFLMTDAKTFLLSGGPGSGKTFLTGHLCNRVMDDYAKACKLMGVQQVYDSLAFTATTNKAAEVLESALNLPVQTIHSFLGLKVTEDYKTGKTRLTKTNSWKQRSNMIIFIDEYSMIDATLYDVILESFLNCKIIFVGDHDQMAPINDPVSPVFTNVDPDNFIFLQQSVRNANAPGLMDLCLQLRSTVETGEFRPIRSVPGMIEYLSDSQMEQKLDEHFKDLNPSARVLCYTNERVQQYNEHIRENVRGMPAEIQEGDTLVVAQASQSLTGQMLNVEREMRVLALDAVIEDEQHTLIFPDSKPIAYQQALLRACSGDAIDYRVNIPMEMERVTYAKKYYARRKMWPEYFELKNGYADLRDKACCTVYKSQGSTYDTVFIDIGNIGTSFSADQVARMLFVAVSRATTRVYLYGRLPGRYQGARAA